MKMFITDFVANQIKEATILAKANYNEERLFVPALPQIDTLPDLSEFVDNGLGVAAIEDDTLIGFLCFFNPWDNAFGTTYAKGTFSPIHAHGTVTANREYIYKLLYQNVAEKLVKAGISSHSIALYAHDTPAITSFFTNGFGLRCVDAIRPMVEIECATAQGYAFRELSSKYKSDTLLLKNLLIQHFEKSPTFLRYYLMKEQDLQQQFDERNPRYFCAYHNNNIVAWIEIMDGGENFACYDDSIQNICGAFCLTEHRGRDVYQNLLNFVISTLKGEGYSRLGVDFESINPTANRFWLKYFTAYTNSVVRRIDEKIFDLRQ